MDARRFDALTRTLSGAGSRRGLLGLIAALPLVGGLLAPLTGEDEIDAKGRKKRPAKTSHRQRPSAEKKRKKKKKCKTTAQVCAGKCGSVTFKCKKRKKTADCGSCACNPPCDVCFTCQEQGPTTPGTCIVDPAKQGQACGATGQICQSDGACACDASTCENPNPVCVNGSCAVCSASAPCPHGCCANDGTCQAGTSDEVCGADGESCQACSEETPVCWDGDCVCGDVCADGCQFNSVQDAIDAANDGDTILVCAGTYGGEALFADNQKTLTLRGAGEGEDGTVLDGQNGAHAVNVINGTTAHLQKLRITGATETGVYVPESSVTLTNCTITGNANNVEDGGGGGLLTRSPSSSAILTDCTVSSNTTAEEGGGILNVGGTVTLENTLVTDNNADGGGGGIYNTANGTINLTGSTSVAGNVPDNCSSNGTGTYNGGSRCAPAA